ncbi:HAMP domain-containing protein [Acidimicrobiaceae bacterium USS-CC1]|uniref:histidine kinase n=1 Tax=Acidiferrimicrobium australe TaxID=2664430 RepID=A0ABW9QQ39_9ACTN|nr:HAMP domain-containing protein [Acidiferrimicrobium australe]
MLVVHGVLLVAVLGTVTVEVVHGFSSHYTHTIVTDLSEEGPEYARAAAQRPAGQTMEAFSRGYLETHVLAGGHLLVVGLRGQAILASAGAGALASRPTVAGWVVAPPLRSELRDVAVGTSRYLVLASPIRTTGGSTVGVLVAAASLAGLAAQRDQVLLLAAGEAVVAVAAGLLSSFLVMRRLLHTVGAVTEAAVAASVGDLGGRLGGAPGEGGAGDEVGRLRAAFDQMRERIAAGLDAQRQLLSDVSHQLRTPLTVARGHLEVLARNPAPERAEMVETTARVIAELEGMSVLVDRLLLLGRSFAPDFVEAAPVALRAFMGDLFAAARVLAERGWALAAVPDVVVVVDGPKLRGALLNLVDNAVKATGTGDGIELGARCATEVAFWVTDTGSGIAAAAQGEVFGRFRRSGSSGRQGTGLGLAIVEAVAEAHGGRVGLHSVEGRGTTVEIVLPGSCLRPGGVGSEDDDG